MYIATFYYWRPGQSWSVPEGEGIVFVEDSYDLGTRFLGSESFPKLVHSRPSRQILSNSDIIAWTLVTGLTEDDGSAQETPFTNFICFTIMGLNLFFCGWQQNNLHLKSENFPQVSVLLAISTKHHWGTQ